MIKLLVGLGVVAALGGGGYLAADRYVDQQAETALDQVLNEQGLSDRVSYQQVDAALFDQTIEIANITIRDPNQQRNYATIAQIKVTDYQLQDDIPVALDVQINGLTIPASNNPDVLDKDLIINGQVAYILNPDLGTFSIEQISFSATDFGSFTFSLQLADVDFESLAQISQTDSLSQDQLAPLTAKMGRTQLVRAALSFQDQGALDQSLAAIAAEQGTTPEQLRDEALEGIDQALAQQNNPVIQDALRKAQTILQGGDDRIQVTLTPDPSLSVEAISGLYLASVFSGSPEPLLEAFSIEIK